MTKLACVLLDGLGFEAAGSMRFPEGIGAPVRMGKIRAELPPLSRPAYATLFSGLAPKEHGILDNSSLAAAPRANIFEEAARADFKSCAAAYYWFHELFNAQSFELAGNRLILGADLPIGNALFYQDDAYPDAELFADAEALRKLCDPHLLLAHSMGIDYAGHAFGGNSREYRLAVENVDRILQKWLPAWLGEGFRILVLSDHGMDKSGRHEADNSICRDCPCWLIGAWNGMAIPETAKGVANLMRETLFGPGKQTSGTI